MRTRVSNCSTRKPEGHTVYIGRPAEFGNPFALVNEQSRPEVIRQFAEYLLEKFDAEPLLLYRWTRRLQGQVLGCHCYPKACHGHVLAALVDGLEWDAYLPEGWDKEQLPLFGGGA